MDLRPEASLESEVSRRLRHRARYSALSLSADRLGLPPVIIPDFKNLDKIIPGAIMICTLFLFFSLLISRHRRLRHHCLAREDLRSSLRLSPRRQSRAGGSGRRERSGRFFLVLSPRRFALPLRPRRELRYVFDSPSTSRGAQPSAQLHLAAADHPVPLHPHRRHHLHPQRLARGHRDREFVLAVRPVRRAEAALAHVLGRFPLVSRVSGPHHHAGDRGGADRRSGLLSALPCDLHPRGAQAYGRVLEE